MSRFDRCALSMTCFVPSWFNPSRTSHFIFPPAISYFWKPWWFKLSVMKKTFCLLFICCTLMVNAQLKYPETRKIELVEDYHGTKVEDPYRWLEDDQSDSTKSWVKEENKVTFD